MKTNLLEKINLEEIVAITSSGTNGKHYVNVTLQNGDIIRHSMNDAFGIHYCNEFIRSLKVYDEAYLEECLHNHIHLYEKIISDCNYLIHIKKVLDLLHRTDITANQIYLCILNRILPKHNVSYDEAILHRPLKEWVQEAVIYFN